MTTKIRPYFLENPEWYMERHDEDGYVHYELTDKAPPEAIESYEDYMSDDDYGLDNNLDEDFRLFEEMKSKQ